jgi:hypothetical protein
MTNLRMKKTRINKIHFEPSIRCYSVEQELKAIMSWAPSHLQLALLTELLGYANLINGLKYKEKIKLRNELEGKEIIKWFQSKPRVGLKGDLFDTSSDFLVTIITGENKKPTVCFEISSEYLGYLRRLLKPHLKD